MADDMVFTFMDTEQPVTHLFTIRLWLEELGDGQQEWRGKVQQIPGGEAYYFRDWTTLARRLQAMLPPAKSSGGEAG